MTVITNQEQENTVYNYLKNITGYINHKEVARDTGMDEAQARSVIHRLISQGAVKRAGFIPGMGSRYEVNPLASMNTPRVVLDGKTKTTETKRTTRRRRSFGIKPDAKETLVRSRIIRAIERSGEPITAYKIRTIVREDADYLKTVIRRMVSAGLIEGKQRHEGPRAKRYFSVTNLGATTSAGVGPAVADGAVDYIGDRKFLGKSSAGTHSAQYNEVTRREWQIIASYVAENGSIYAEEVTSIIPTLAYATAYNRVKQMVEMGILTDDNDPSLEQNTSRSRRYLKLADPVPAQTQPESEPEQVEEPTSEQVEESASEQAVSEVIGEASDAVVEANTTVAKTTARITLSIEGDVNDPSVVAIIKALASR